MMKLAKGEKVLDDPKLLKRSLKRMQKDKQKSKEGWKVRTEAVRKKQADRQERYVPVLCTALCGTCATRTLWT